jgi:hypothetical protein
LNPIANQDFHNPMTLQDAIQALDQGDWDKAHRIVQGIEGESAAWFHGILHMIEGDESNAQYWYRRAGRPYPGKAKIQEELSAIKVSLA